LLLMQAAPRSIRITNDYDRSRITQKKADAYNMQTS
jgi:hypothetical protein